MTAPASVRAADASDTLLRGACDACNARALVLTEHRRPDGPALALQWCKHHFERHQRAMGAAGALVLVDNRHELYPPGTH